MNTPLLTDRPADNDFSPTSDLPAPSPEVVPDSGRVSRRMLRERAVEVARIAGRAAHEATTADWEEAKTHFNQALLP
jgi:hypothetical protein